MLEVPETKRPVKLWPWVFLLAAIVVAAGGYFLRDRIAPLLQKNQSAPSVSPEERITRVKSTLLQQAKFRFPATISSQTIQIQDWPEDLTALLPQDASAKITKVTYFDGHSGYSFQAEQLSALQDSYFHYQDILRSMTGWTLVNSVRANAFSLLEGESEKYKAQITHEFIDEKKSVITVQIYLK